MRFVFKNFNIILFVFKQKYELFYALPPVVSLLSFILPPRQQAVRLPNYLRVKNSGLCMRVYFVG